VADLSLRALAKIPAVFRAVAPSKLPSMRRDIALLVARTHPAGAIADALRESAGPRCADVSLFDRYVGKELPSGTHSLAYTLTFTPVEKALTDGEVDGWVQAALARVSQRFEAIQR
jgi:phenylalanyl-tRNA synthetase beta chain